MAEKRGFDFLDYLLIITKWKKLLILLSIFILAISYLTIYLFIDEQYDSRTLIVASEDDQSGMFSSLLKSFSDFPISIPGITKGTDMDIFTTIIYSRSSLEKIVAKFDLYNEYGYDTMEETLEELTGKIEADETKEGAYEIIARGSSPQKAADMANYIVELMNETMIELDIAKSKDNRLFLEKRYFEIKNDLKSAEDSLIYYQGQSGIILVEEQAKASFEAYSKLEAELAVKQVELSILNKVFGNESPQVSTAKIAADEFEKKLNEIKNGKDHNSLILSLDKLPNRAMQYLRHLRDVEIYNKMLEVIIPLYEQSRFEEQKNIPMLQVIDVAVPAEKKAYPQRALFSILFTLIIMLIVLSLIFFKEYLDETEDPKILQLKKSFKRNN